MDNRTISSMHTDGLESTSRPGRHVLDAGYSDERSRHPSFQATARFESGSRGSIDPDRYGYPEQECGNYQGPQ